MVQRNADRADDDRLDRSNSRDRNRVARNPARAARKFAAPGRGVLHCLHADRLERERAQLHPSARNRSDPVAVAVRRGGNLAGRTRRPGSPTAGLVRCHRFVRRCDVFIWGRLCVVCGACRGRASPTTRTSVSDADRDLRGWCIAHLLFRAARGRCRESECRRVAGTAVLRRCAVRRRVC